MMTLETDRESPVRECHLCPTWFECAHFGDMPTASPEPAAGDPNEPSVDDFMLAYRAMRGRFQIDLLPIIGEQYDPRVPDTASDESRKAAWRTTLTKWKRADPSHSFRKILDDHAESVAAAVRAAKGE